MIIIDIPIIMEVICSITQITFLVFIFNDAWYMTYAI